MPSLSFGRGGAWIEHFTIKYPITNNVATMIRPTQALFKRSVWKGMRPLPAVSYSKVRRSKCPLTLPWPGPNLVPFPLPKTLPPPPGTPAIRTRARAATILPNFVGIKFAVHNGKTYQEIFITEEMVGRKLGEFVLLVFLLKRKPKKI